MKLILAGATGLVGSEILRQGEAAGHEVVTVGRRSLDRGTAEIITSFHDPLELPEADAALCTLGTTIDAAGSQAAFYAVDHDAVLNFAQAAVAAGIEHFLMVTAVGADPRAKVFYSRVKGETEQDIQKLGFQRLDIAQPGLLLGPREERRPVERFLQITAPVSRRLLLGPLDRYAGIEASSVASALLELCETRPAPGAYRHENRALRQLAAAS